MCYIGRAFYLTVDMYRSYNLLTMSSWNARDVLLIEGPAVRYQSQRS